MKLYALVWILFLVGCAATTPERKLQHPKTVYVEAPTSDNRPLSQVAATDIGEQSDGSFVACAENEEIATQQARHHFELIGISTNTSVLVGHDEFTGCARVSPQK